MGGRDTVQVGKQDCLRALRENDEEKILNGRASSANSALTPS